MSIASLPSIASLSAAVARARQADTGAGSGDAPTPPVPRVQRTPAAIQQAEDLSAQAAQELAYQRLALAQLQANLQAVRLQRSDPVLGSLLNVSA